MPAAPVLSSKQRAAGKSVKEPEVSEDHAQQQESLSLSPERKKTVGEKWSEPGSWSFTLAFFLMCFSSGCTEWAPGCDKAPKEYFFKGGRWNWRNFIGPMWVGKKGWRSSTAGMECYTKAKDTGLFSTKISHRNSVVA